MLSPGLTTVGAVLTGEQEGNQEASRAPPQSGDIK